MWHLSGVQPLDCHEKNGPAQDAFLPHSFSEIQGVNLPNSASFIFWAPVTPGFLTKNFPPKKTDPTEIGDVQARAPKREWF